MAATAERFGIAPHTRVIAFCPGAEFGPAKRWPAAHFAELAQMLRRSFPYAQIITLGSAKDAEIAAEIVAGAPFVRNLCGQTSLDDAVDLLALSEARRLQRLRPDARDRRAEPAPGGRFRLQRPAPYAPAVTGCEYHVAATRVQPLLQTRVPAGPPALP